ncbi:class I SAM-dependent methyltransferase [Paenibacillus radicis (ex Gao et al. 2016)]|uniref:Methyltransferase n=1 Tax=Paenibacillus radicis (ex Gao et al. 2016) TaxID=1737354 RepID=A0A917LY01_9BACL|nr:class I SAM-dependent methyltransferase [Paenibacillus radicis (ex Gao et al. 2016)]GGG64520.1 methyltransferase [Paenibacillus radicis (ex Gao et al. 2016)]
MSFSYYGPLCTAVYDHTKKVGQSFGGDIEYYSERLKHCKGRILEPMVGSGRVLIPLLEGGLQVDGIDYSPEMLASCRQRCEERGLKAELLQADLQQLSLPQRYEAIIIPGGSFLLIEKREESLNVLRRLYDHLQPGGRLLLDLFLPDSANDGSQFGGNSTFHLPDGDIITMEGKLVEFDLFHQYKISYLKYEKWRNGVLLQTELQRLALRWYGVEEFKLVLENIGFTDVVISADFEYGKAPNSGNQKFVYEAVRKE